MALITRIIGGMSWMVVARFVRLSFLAIRNQDFVEAARASGGNSARLMVRHMRLNALGDRLRDALDPGRSRC